MNGLSVESALATVQEVLGQRLTEVQQAVFRGVWQRQSYQDIIDTAAENGYYYSLGHLKNTGSDLWQALTDGLGERVTKTNLQEVLERYQSQRVSKTYQDWGGAVASANFYGRAQELDTLKQWVLQDACRVVSILGMGGMGKTSLARHLAQELLEAPQFQSAPLLFWRSLLNAPPLEEMLEGMIQLLSEQQEVKLPATIEGKIARVLHYLRQNRCLIVLDNLESILQSGNSAGVYRPGYEGYGLLIQQIGEAEHLSCLLLTSREKPREVARLEGVNSPVRSFALKGLTTSEIRTIFQQRGCFGLEQRQLQQIVDHYAGNPLALNIVASGVQELFDGDMAELLPFLQQGYLRGYLRFDDINDTLSRQFDRLSAAEQEVMYWLAINREPLSHTELAEDIVSMSVKPQLLDALRSLRRRCLVEFGQKQWSLQPVVMEYVTNRLIEQVCAEIQQQQYGLLTSFALLKAQGKDYIRQAQNNLVLQPILDCLLSHLGGRKNVEYQLKQMLEKARAEAPLQPGYVGGNVLNLLRRLDSDLTGVDCSYLAVWQADLAGVSLSQTNFAHADLSKSVFTETFGTVASLAVSPRGDLFASGGEFGEIHLWQAQDKKAIKVFQGHMGWVLALAFSPDGQKLASASDDWLIKIWDAASDCVTTLKDHTDWVWSVAFSPDGQTLASASADCTVRLWNIDTEQVIQVLKEHTQTVRAVAFSPDGQTLASVSDDCTVKLWNMAGQCLRTLIGHQHWVGSVAFSPDGQTLATGSMDTTIRLWNLHDGQRHVLSGHSGPIRSIAFSPDGKTLVSGSNDHLVKLWNVKTGQCLKTLSGHTDWVWAVATVLQTNSDDTTTPTLISGDGNNTLKLWNINTGQCFKTWQGYTAQVHSIAFDRSGELLCSGASDGTVSLWEANSGLYLKAFRGSEYRTLSVAVSPTGSIIAGGNKTVILWNAKTGELLHTFREHSSFIASMCFDTTGRILATGSFDATVKLWDVYTGQCLKTLKGHRNLIWSVAFSPDNQLLISGGSDHTIKLWDVHTGKCLETWQNDSLIRSAVFSPDGKTFASSGGDPLVNLWDINSGRYLRTLQGACYEAKSVAFSLDGKLLAMGGEDQVLKIWEVSTGECIKTLYGHTGRIYTVAFQPNSQILASGSQDQTIRVWQVETGDCLRIMKLPCIYEAMNIAGATGLTIAQRAALLSLGAIDI